MKITFVTAFICLFLICQPSVGDIESNLVAYYNMEGLAGSTGEQLADISGNNHHGIAHGNRSTLKAPTIVPGPDGLGEATSYDGSFYFEIPNHADFNITSQITIATWFRVGQFNTEWQTMFCRGDWSWRIARNSSTNGTCMHLSGFGSNWGSSGAINVNDGQWHHLVGVWPGSGQASKLWIDGQRDTNSDLILTGSISTTGSDPVTIGAQIDSGTLRRQWIGALDEVRLYNRALTDSEVAELYSFRQSGNYNTLPTVTVPEEISVNFLKDAISVDVTISASVADDGNPLPADPVNPDPDDSNKLSWSWQTIVKPDNAPEPFFHSSNPADISGWSFVYNNPNEPIDLMPKVTFYQYGRYQLQLTAVDGEKTTQATTTVQVNPPSYRELGYLYLSPIPRAEYCSAQTRFVLVRFQDISPEILTNLSSFITVSGASSGNHPGNTHIATDGRTVIFEMANNFNNNELVTVSLAPEGTAGEVEPYQYQFMVTAPMPDSTYGLNTLNDAIEFSSASIVAVEDNVKDDVKVREQGNISTSDTDQEGPRIMPNGVSVPSNFPHVNITINNNPSDGYIFMDNRVNGADSYNVILDNNGSPIWYMQANDERRDMKVLPNGLLTMLVREGGLRYVTYDQNYNQVGTYAAVNGYTTDEHELILTPSGNYFLIGMRFNNVDMSRYISGGNTNCSVSETVIQEFTPAGELIFQWRGWDNFDVRDTHFDNIYSSSFRFPHMNAIDVDDDGHILLSSRHVSEITKINRDSGEVIWRLSGYDHSRSDFTFVDDPLDGFSCQHSIHSMGNNRYLFYDNGNYHSPSESRAVEYQLDLEAKTATLYWQFRDNKYSWYMGNVQRLPNGNTLINWVMGNYPKVTEVTPEGTKVHEVSWVKSYETYRVSKHQWNGKALKPVLAEVYNQPDNVTLVFNQFGDPDVSYYNIYGDIHPGATNLLDTSVTTLKRVAGLSDGQRYYFRVTSVNKLGIESDYSNELYADVRIINPGDNMIINGDFSLGSVSWSLNLNSSTATWGVSSGQGQVVVTKGGSQITDVKFLQGNLPIVNGEEYRLEFDVRSTPSPRIIDVRVGRDSNNYSNISAFNITPSVTHKSFNFTMNQTSDYNTQIIFNLGGYANSTIYLDNISLTKILRGDFDTNGCVDIEDLAVLATQWLNTGGSFQADLDHNQTVELNDFSIFAENWLTGCTNQPASNTLE